MKYKDTDYYYFDTEQGDIFYTERYLIESGECCGTGCRHCPYDPRDIYGNSTVKQEFAYLKDIKDDKNIA
jgi:hypothetical protein